MTFSSNFEAILTDRAEKLATRSKASDVREDKTPISVVVVGAETFGIPTRYLSCIIKSPPVAKMPNLPPWLRGIAQIRGEIVGIVDIAKWFAVPGALKGNFLAVVEENGRKLGLLLDTVKGFRDIGHSDIAETFSAGTVGGHPIRATTKDVTTILDIPKMFMNPDMLVDPGMADYTRAAGSSRSSTEPGSPTSGQ